MLETDKAWAAGFFDGEGCIYLAKVKNHGGNLLYELRVEAAQIDPLPIIKLHEMFGGWKGKQTIKIGSKRDVHKWKLSSLKAEYFLETVLPYLTTKRTQAVLGLEFRKLISRKNHIMSSEQMTSRENIYIQLKELKRVEF